jgi:DHA1 family multidrug resistance protein-like MFS transporter
MNPEPATASADPGDSLPEAAGRRVTYLTALAVFLAGGSFNFWWPFLALYAIDLGATSDANALLWVSIATTSQGICRLLSSPLWGVLADRLGRKLMFLRTLYLAALTGVAAAIVAEPWQLAIALGLQGIFSGFIAPAVALVSVSVPDERLNKSISLVNGAQYLGSTVGPAVGALLAIAFGFRGTILVGATLPLVAGAIIHLFVPRDRIAGRTATGKAVPLEPMRFNLQFGIALGLFTMLFAANQLVRFITPIALKAIEHKDDVEAISGVAFSLGGAFSAISVLFVASQIFVPGRMRPSLAVSCVLAGTGMILLALAASAPIYIVGFILITIMISAMVPATNTLIAMNVVRSRRGTAFGVASSAQAIAFMIGPFGATIITAVSLDAGFVILAALMALLGVVLLLLVREPKVQDETAPAAEAVG